MFSNTKYSNEFRLKLVLEYLEGNDGIREFGRKYGISPSHITNWIRLYKANGREGLLITKKIYYSEEFKIKVIKYMLDNKLSINKTAPLFGIPVPSTLWRWFQEYKKKENQDVVMKEEIMTKKSKSQNNKKNKEITNTTIKQEELSSNVLLEEINNLRKQLEDKDKELKETKDELYHTQMQRDIIKKKLKYFKIEEEISIESSVLIIADLKRTYSVKDLLGELNIPKSTFYDNFKYVTKDEDGSFIYVKPDKYIEQKEVILKIFNLSGCTYGYRRIKDALDALKEKKYNLNHKTVQNLMKELNIKSTIRCHKKSNNNISSGEPSSNIINRNFEASHPNEKWATDITEFKFTNNEKFYLSAVIDMFNSEVINYTIGNSPNLELVKNMMLGAIKNVSKNDLKNLILHSDQGWHYRHQNFRAILEEFKINQSMSRKGTPIDNAKMESFFAILKTEFLTKENINHFNNVDELLIGLDNFINFYNTERIKLKFKTSPVKYRQMKEIDN